MDELNKQNIGKKPPPHIRSEKARSPFRLRVQAHSRHSNRKGRARLPRKHSWASWSARAAAMRLNPRRKNARIAGMKNNLKLCKTAVRRLRKTESAARSAERRIRNHFISD